MQLKIDKYPSFITKGAKVLSDHGGTRIGDITVSDFVELHKMALYEVLTELQTPPEESRLFYTRQQAADRLGIGITKFCKLEQRGLLKRHYIGKTPIYLEESLRSLITNEKYDIL